MLRVDEGKRLPVSTGRPFRTPSASSTFSMTSEAFGGVTRLRDAFSDEGGAGTLIEALGAEDCRAVVVSEPEPLARSGR
jgi:hypothetical protein